MVWQDDYRKAMQELVVKRGSPIFADLEPDAPEPEGFSSHRDHYYSGPIDYNDLDVGAGGWRSKLHLDSCGIKKYGSVLEQEWSEFEGTFVTSDHPRHGVDVKVTCNCGEVSRSFRYEATVGTMLKQLLEETDND